MNKLNPSDLWKRMEEISSSLQRAIEREGVSQNYGQYLPEKAKALPYSTEAHKLAVFVAASKGSYSAEEKALAREALSTWQAFRRECFDADEDKIDLALAYLSREKERLRARIRDGAGVDEDLDQYELESALQSSMVGC